MGRYANPLVRLDFPDLSEEDDPIYVVIRNPKTVPLDTLTGPVDNMAEDSTTAEQKTATYGVIAGLIVDWHVYDATIDGDSDPLPLPATGDAVATLPFEITQQLMEEIGKVTLPPT